MSANATTIDDTGNDPRGLFPWRNAVPGADQSPWFGDNPCILRGNFDPGGTVACLGLEESQQLPPTGSSSGYHGFAAFVGQQWNILTSAVAPESMGGQLESPLSPGYLWAETEIKASLLSARVEILAPPVRFFDADIISALASVQAKGSTERGSIQQPHEMPLRERLRTDRTARKRFLSGIMATMAYEGADISWEEANQWLDEVLDRPPRRLRL